MRPSTALLALVVLLAGCQSSPPPSPTRAPSPPVSAAVGDLCTLLAAQDFQETAGVSPGPAGGGGTATAATCTYGEHLELIVQIRPTVDDAAAVYDALLKSGWFASDVAPGPIAAVDQSTYGSGPDAAAIVLRRQRLVVLVTVPRASDRSVDQPALIQLCGRVLARAGALGT